MMSGVKPNCRVIALNVLILSNTVTTSTRSNRSEAEISIVYLFFRRTKSRFSCDGCVCFWRGSFLLVSLPVPLSQIFVDCDLLA